MANDLFQNSYLKKHSFYFFEEQFFQKQILILENNLRTSQEQSQACCPTEHKKKVFRLSILKIIKTKTSEQSLTVTYLLLHLYLGEVLKRFATTYFEMSWLERFLKFNRREVCIHPGSIHLSNLFIYYTLDSQVCFLPAREFA